MTSSELADVADVVVAIAAVAALAFSGFTLWRDLRDRKADRQGRLEGRAARQATAVRPKAVVDSGNATRRTPFFSIVVTNSSDGDIFDVDVVYVVERDGEWMPQDPIGELMPWHRETITAGNRIALGNWQAEAPNPQLRVHFTDQFGDRWQRDPDDELTLLAQVTVRPAARRRNRAG